MNPKLGSSATLVGFISFGAVLLSMSVGGCVTAQRKADMAGFACRKDATAVSGCLPDELSISSLKFESEAIICPECLTYSCVATCKGTEFVCTGTNEAGRSPRCSKRQ